MSKYVGVIYRHWRIDEQGNEKSYIGKHCGNDVQRNRWGTNGNKYRPRKGEKPTHFWNAIEKYGWDGFHHDIILRIECDTKHEVDFWLYSWEKYYIEKYDAYCNGYNMTLGGDGFTSETSMRLWRNEKYRNDRIEGTKKLWQNEQYRQRQIDIHTTPQFKQHMTQCLGKKVMCLNTGEVFNSIHEAGRWCHMKDTSSGDIARCCKGKRKTAGKHPITREKLKWKYV